MILLPFFLICFGFILCSSFPSLVFPAQRSSFSIYCKAGLILLNSLNFCLSGKLLISLSNLKGSLAGWSILGWRFFPFITLNISCHSLLKFFYCFCVCVNSVLFGAKIGLQPRRQHLRLTLRDCSKETGEGQREYMQSSTKFPNKLLLLLTPSSCRSAFQRIWTYRGRTKMPMRKFCNSSTLYISQVQHHGDEERVQSMVVSRDNQSFQGIAISSTQSHLKQYSVQVKLSTH